MFKIDVPSTLFDKVSTILDILAGQNLVSPEAVATDGNLDDGAPAIVIDGIKIPANLGYMASVEAFREESDRLVEEMVELDGGDPDPEENRAGDWIETFTGVQFYPHDIRDGDIVIDDIAHALANSARFSGHTRSFYSVAEHSVRATWQLPPDNPRLKLEALLHDASEAYLNDVARPVKYMPEMAPYRALEESVDRAIRREFYLPPTMSPEVKLADDNMLRSEAFYLMPSKGLARARQKGWSFPPDSAVVMEIDRTWSPDLAEHRFRETFYALVEQIADRESTRF